MDTLDLSITKLLVEDVRMSFMEIARRLDISEPTARNRAKKLIDTGKIHLKVLVSPDDYPEIIIAYVGIKTASKPSNSLDQVNKVPSVIYAVNTLGGYDILACVVSNSRESLAHTMSEELCGEGIANIKIISTETHIALYNRNLLIPVECVINSILEGMDKKPGK
ncbi:Lrp/AsnC family transcriptional regulator [Candidatus Omnitrophota bacterium]